MALDIKSLLSKYRIHWRDRGPNVSHGNIVINCPFCARTSNPDHGEHLAISTVGEYFCYRNPSHKGMNLPRLLILLNIPKHEYEHLNLDYKEAPRTQKDEKDFSLIRFFQKGDENQEVLDYLASRHFTRPVETCRKFRLLTDKEGKWAGRLIIPLTVGWTGRAMRDHLDPRYLAWTTEDGFFLYRQQSSSCIVLEGAIDGMRIVSVSSQFDIIGKCGNRLSPALLNYLRQARYMTIWNAPDGDVDFNQFFQETKLLRSYCTSSIVKQFHLPDFKDFGQMQEHQARRIVSTIQ